MTTLITRPSTPSRLISIKAKDLAWKQRLPRPESILVPPPLLRLRTGKATPAQIRSMAGRIESERAAVKRTKKGDVKRWDPVIVRSQRQLGAPLPLGLSLHRRDQGRE